MHQNLHASTFQAYFPLCWKTDVERQNTYLLRIISAGYPTFIYVGWTNVNMTDYLLDQHMRFWCLIAKAPFKCPCRYTQPSKGSAILSASILSVCSCAFVQTYQNLRCLPESSLLNSVLSTKITWVGSFHLSNEMSHAAWDFQQCDILTNVDSD